MRRRKQGPIAKNKNKKFVEDVRRFPRSADLGPNPANCHVLDVFTSLFEALFCFHQNIAVGARWWSRGGTS